MDRHVARLYAVALAIVVLVFAWAAIAARPWAPASGAADPVVAALQAREAAVRREAARVKRLIDERWANYRVALARRQRQIAATERSRATAVTTAPGVRVVNLPPLTVTRTS